MRDHRKSSQEYLSCFSILSVLFDDESNKMESVPFSYTQAFFPLTNLFVSITCSLLSVFPHKIPCAVRTSWKFLWFITNQAKQQIMIKKAKRKMSLYSEYSATLYKKFHNNNNSCCSLYNLKMLKIDKHMWKLNLTY